MPLQWPPSFFFHFFPLLLLCVISSFPMLTIAASSAVPSNVTLSALLSLKATITSDPSHIFSSWNTSTHFCTWQGILCSNNSQQVMGIILNSSQLIGALPPQLVDLQSLAYLDVSNNNFQGPIPVRLGNLAATLTHLDIGVNNLTGDIPSSLASCTLLQYIDLNNNSLRGSFPSYLSNFTELRYVDMSINPITGELPSDIGRLSNLRFFQMFRTSLSGSIPPSLMNCSNLVWLDLADALLSGPLPSDWSKLSPTLQKLKLFDSNFSGGLPPSLANCSKLTTLDLQNNSFIGEIPDSLGKLTRLQDLRLFYNHLSGAIPPSLLNCTQLVFLELSMNNLTGVVPQDIGRLTRLQYLTLSGNRFLEGSIPASIGRCTQLQHLSLYATSLRSSLPSSLFNLTSLQTLSLQNCAFSGKLSGLVGQLTSLTGSLDMSNNAFYGPLPAELGELKHLQGLYLQDNHFEGSIPHQLSGLTSLAEMNLSSNPLSGSVPSSFAHLSSLNKLSIRNTHLSGPIPDIFAQLQRLEVLELDHNMFTGSIPNSLATLYSLSVSLDLSSNKLAGSIPPSLGAMQKLQTMDLSGNTFFGEIPSSLGGCQGMQELDLSANRLKGKIPDALGQMISLQYLDLSQNDLSGTLPSSLGLLDGLAFLNVSYNELQGTIPAGGVYGNSSEFSFVGNPGLCGYPSSTSCGASESGNSHRKIAIIVSVCVAGSAIVAALLCACLWRWCRMSGRKDAIALEESDSEELEEDFVDIDTPRFKGWKAKELRLATNNFDAANVLGSGAVSVCYKGVMLDDVKGSIKRVVAVKRLNMGDSHGVEARRSFVNELKTICKVRHRNLVKVLGYCVEGGEVALVMEYMEMGDLDGHLHDAKGSLCWEDRLNVAVDVAEGLVYLHHEYVQPIVHCDLNPKNILLSTDGVAKISDFGIAKLLDLSQAVDVSISKFRGTFGYAAPEYATGVRISTKADVYSYGVLLLELVTGIRPTSAMLQEGMTLHTWAQIHQESGRAREVLDKAILLDIATDNKVAQEVAELMRLGVACSMEAVKDRPPMRAARDFVVSLKNQRLSYNNKTNIESAYPKLDELLQDHHHHGHLFPNTTKLLWDSNIQINSSYMLTSSSSYG